MLLRTEMFKIHAVCATNEDVPESLISPDLNVMNLFKADNSVDLPHPTGPIIMVKLPGSMLMETFDMPNGSCCGKCFCRRGFIALRPKSMER